MVGSAGAPISKFTSTISVGPKGPTVMEDSVLLEDVQQFVRGRIPERLFHARGNSARGTFVVTNDITRYCDAKLFQEVGKETPLLFRWSLAVGSLGVSETARRTLRGMAVKFYTEEGNWDLTTNSLPVFMANDPFKVPGLRNATDFHPRSNLPNADMFFDFLASNPESTFFSLLIHGDMGMPFSYRHMTTFAGNTYKLVNKHGEAVYCRFQLTTDQGFRPMDPTTAARLAASNPDYKTEDMFRAIERGEFPSWTLYIQVMSFETAEQLEFNPFNVTKIWPEDRFPLIEVGRLTANRNVQNHWDESELAAFSPINLVPGIRMSPDKNLQVRALVYNDTQLHRLGANFNQLPINQPLQPVRNYQREGRGRYVSQGAAPVYFPNSVIGSPVESVRAQQLEPSYKACGDVKRYDNDETADHYSQPRHYYLNEIDEDHRERMIANYVAALTTVRSSSILEQKLKVLANVDQSLADRIEEGLERANNK